MEEFTTLVSMAESIRRLAKAHSLSEAEMTARWRAAHRAPPEEIARIQKFSSPKLLAFLGEEARKVRNQVLESAEARAFASTQIRELAQKRPTVEQALGWITDPLLKRFALGFEPGDHGGAILLGPTGVGKSIACFCVMRRVILRDALAAEEELLAMPFDETLPPVKPLKQWACFDVLDLGEAQQRTPLGNPESPDLVHAKEAHYAILEDLGWERNFHRETILSLAATRIKHGRPSLITAGEKHSVIQEAYGDAVLRRFRKVSGQKGVLIDLWEEGKKS